MAVLLVRRRPSRNPRPPTSTNFVLVPARRSTVRWSHARDLRTVLPDRDGLRRQFVPELLAVGGELDDRRPFAHFDRHSLQGASLVEANQERVPVDFGNSGPPERGDEYRHRLRAELEQRAV